MDLDRDWESRRPEPLADTQPESLRSAQAEDVLEYLTRCGPKPLAEICEAVYLPVFSVMRVFEWWPEKFLEHEPGRWKVA